MSVRIIVRPTGPKATPEAIEAWKKAAQKVADENGAEVELKNRDKGRIVAHIIARPD